MILRSIAAAVVAIGSFSMAQAAPVSLDFHVEVTAGSPPTGATRMSPFAGSLTVDDSQLGLTGISVDSFFLNWFDRVITESSSGFNDFFVDLSLTGAITKFSFGYDSFFDLSIDTERLSATAFNYDYTGGTIGSGFFRDGAIPITPPGGTPVGGTVPLPATAPLLLFGLLGAGAWLRRRRPAD